MKICPQCGSDVLDSAASRCSSCGSDLIPATSDGPVDGEPRTSTRPSASFRDDNAPIEKSDDLELVHGGQAFWTEPTDPQPSPNDVEDTDPELKAESGEPVKPAESENSAPLKAGLNPSVLFATDRPAKHAPSLAELAQARKANPSSRETLDESGSQRIDGDLEEQAAQSSGATTEDATDSIRIPRAAQDPEGPRSGATARISHPARANFDDTSPTGLRTSPATSGKTTTAIEDIPRPDMTVLSKSPDVAFIDDNRLLIPGQRWAPGEKVVVAGHTYELKRKLQKYPFTPRQAVAGFASFVAGALFAWMWMAGQADPTSRVFGAIRNAENGKLLAGVTVAIEDNGRTVESDPTGMFYFDGLHDGIYTLVATDPIYGKSRQAVTISGDATSVLLELEAQEVDLASVPPVEKSPANTTRPAASKPAAQSSNTQAASNEPGKLAVTASVPNAKIFLDGKMLGVGNSVYTGIRTGKRRVRVEQGDFKPWEKSVTISAGKTTRIEPQLVAEKPPEPKKLTPEQYAAAGRKFMESRQFKLAAEQFNMAIDGSPRPQFYAWRADAHAGLKELPAAQADFLTAMALFQKQNDDARLDDLLQRAVLVVPGSPALHMAYADYHYRHRHLTDAEKYYRRAIELGGDPVKAYIGIGLTHYASGSFDKALTAWTRADEATGEMNAHLAGYIALANARLQHRASCRKAVTRLASHPDVLQQFRGHPDWDRVQRLTGEG